jgi:hypothetical protein
VTSVRAMRSMIRPRTRRARRRRWFDWYSLAFSIALAAIYLANLARRTARHLVTAPIHPTAAHAGTGLSLVLLAGTGLVAAACALGPVAVSPADAAWLLLSPLNRRGVLAVAAAKLLGLSVLAGTSLGLTALAVSDPPGDRALESLSDGLLGAGLAVCTIAAVVLSQPSTVGRARLRAIVVATSVAAAFAAIASARWPGPARSILAGGSGDAAALTTAGVAAAVGAFFLAVLVWRRLTRFPAPAVIAASARAGSIRYAAVSLDVSLLTWAAEDNYWSHRKLVSRPWPRLPGPVVLAWLDWRRLARRPGWLAMLLASALLPVITGLAARGARAVVAAVLLGGALTVSAAASAGAKRDFGSPALGRLMGTGQRTTLAARAVLPAVLSAVWIAIALEALAMARVQPAGLWPLGIAAGPAAAVVGMRLARTGPIDWALAVVDTPLGSFNLGIVGRLVTMCLGIVSCAPMLGAVLTERAASAGPVVVQAVFSVITLGGYLLFARTRRS